MIIGDKSDVKANGSEMNVKNIFVIVTITISAIVVFAFPANAQSMRLERVDMSKPSVYLSFDKFEVDNGKEKIAYFVLHNNSKRPIAVDADYKSSAIKAETIELSDGTKVEALPDRATVVVCFDVDVAPDYGPDSVVVTDIGKKEGHAEPRKPAAANPALGDGRTCTRKNNWRADEFGNGERSWIKGGNSFRFGVPAEYIRFETKMSTIFSYEWEFDEGFLDFDEPKHRVYFYGSDLVPFKRS